MLLDIAEIGGDVDWLPMRAAGVSLVEFYHDVGVTCHGRLVIHAGHLVECAHISDDRRHPQ